MYLNKCRHCACVFYQDWHRTRQPRPAPPGSMLSDVSQQIEPPKAADKSVKPPAPVVTSPRNTLSSSTGLVIAYNETSNHTRNTPAPPPKDAGQSERSNRLPFDEEAKLVYGVLLSLRHMVQKLSGRLVQITIAADQRLSAPSLARTKPFRVTQQRHISYIISKLYQDTSSSCSLIHLRMRCGSFFDRSTLVRSTLLAWNV
jgi:hypothetical protein